MMKPSANRKVRGQRTRAASPVMLTNRDHELLQLLGLCGYATTDQVARDLFPSADRASRRLRQLYDAGLVRVHLAGSRRPNLLSLSPSGRDVLVAAVGDVPGLQLPSAIPLHAIDHHLGVVDVRLLLAALAQREVLQLHAWHGGRSELAAETGLTGAKLVPDGVVELTLGDPGVVAVEVDNGTERLGGALAQKLARYRGPLLARTVTEVWLWASGSAARLEGIRRACVEAGIARRTRLLTPADTADRPARLPGRLA